MVDVVITIIICLIGIIYAIGIIIVDRKIIQKVLTRNNEINMQTKIIFVGKDLKTLLLEYIKDKKNSTVTIGEKNNTCSYTYNLHQIETRRTEQLNGLIKFKDIASAVLSDIQQTFINNKEQVEYMVEAFKKEQGVFTKIAVKVYDTFQGNSNSTYVNTIINVLKSIKEPKNKFSESVVRNMNEIFFPTFLTLWWKTILILIFLVIISIIFSEDYGYFAILIIGLAPQVVIMVTAPRVSQIMDRTATILLLKEIAKNSDSVLKFIIEAVAASIVDSKCSVLTNAFTSFIGILLHVPFLIFGALICRKPLYTQNNNDFQTEP